MKLIIIAALALFFFSVNVPEVLSQENEPKGASFDCINALIEILREKNIIDQKEADKFILRYKQQTIEQGKKRITLVSEEKEGENFERIRENFAKEIKKDVHAQVNRYMEKEVKKEVAKEVGRRSEKFAAPAWANRIRWGGDMRLRYESNLFDENNGEFLKPGDPDKLMNSKNDRHRMRVRVRLKTEAKVNDTLTAAVRIATGNDKTPVSNNETLGDYEKYDDFMIQEAYLKWEPVEYLTLYGGKIPNPWFCSDLVWDNDVRLEGAALQFETKSSQPINYFINMGAFPIEEEEFFSRDKWLIGGQIGFKINPVDKIEFKIGAAYYDYINIEGEKNDPTMPEEMDYTMPGFQQKGNTLMDIDPSGDYKLALASDYDELNITGRLDLAFFDPVHIVFLGDYVKNIGFDKNEVAKKTGNPDPDKETDGYQVGITVGYPTLKKAWDWQTSLFYKRLEADAVLDAFTDSDFHLGGTNAKGWILGGELGVADNCWLRLRWFTTDEIKGPQFAEDTLQMDINARY